MCSSIIYNNAVIAFSTSVVFSVHSRLLGKKKPYTSSNRGSRVWVLYSNIMDRGRKAEVLEVRSVGVPRLAPVCKQIIRRRSTAIDVSRAV